MVLIGFKPEHIPGTLALSLVYRFFIRTRVAGRPDPFEHSGFNAPSLHRVHHGTNEWCIDRNCAGVLIARGRVFETFQREIGPIAHGVITGHCSYNPVG